MNRLKLKDKVELKTKSHTWHAVNMPDMFTSGGQKQFKLEHLEEIVAILGSKAKGVKLKGKVIGYGAQDDDYKDGRKFVYVEFKWNGFKTDFYCSEKDLKKL